jgi:hypothetical protein
VPLVKTGLDRQLGSQRTWTHWTTDQSCCAVLYHTTPRHRHTAHPDICMPIPGTTAIFLSPLQTQILPQQGNQRLDALTATQRRVLPSSVPQSLSLSLSLSLTHTHPLSAQRPESNQHAHTSISLPQLHLQGSPQDLALPLPSRCGPTIRSRTKDEGSCATKGPASLLPPFFLLCLLFTPLPSSLFTRQTSSGSN